MLAEWVRLHQQMAQMLRSSESIHIWWYFVTFFTFSLKLANAIIRQFCQMFIFYWCNMCVCLSSPIIRICLDIRKKLYVWSGIFLVEDDNYFIQKTLIEMLPSWHRTNNLSKYGRKIGKINYRHCLDLEFWKLLLASGFWLKLCLLTWFIRNFLSL